MKKILKNTTSLAALLAVAALVSCIKEIDEPINPISSSSQIKISSVIGSPDSKSVVTTNTPMTGIVFWHDYTLDKNSVDHQLKSSATIFTGERTVAPTGAITWTNADGSALPDAEKPTYDKTAPIGDDIYSVMGACYPGPSSLEAKSKGVISDSKEVEWVIDGRTDILMSNFYFAGSYRAPITNPMIFNHQLSQLEVVLEAEAGVDVKAVRYTWGKIIKIELIDTKPAAKFNSNVEIYENAFSCIGEGIDLPLFDGEGYSKPLEAVEIPMNGNSAIAASGMFAPSIGKIKLKITGDKMIEKIVEFELKDGSTIHNFEKGMRHTVTLTLKAIDANISIKNTTVTPWKSGGIFVEEVTSAPNIGQYINDGIVYWVDPTNPANYKVIALDDKSSQTDEMVWSAKSSYILRVNGQHTTDGRKNVIAMKEYSTLHKNDAANAMDKTTGVLATDFPAADYCSNYRGKKGQDPLGSWYLPAINEWEVFLSQWTAHKQTIDLAISENSGNAIFVGYVSSTESSLETNKAWSIILNPPLTGPDSRPQGPDIFDKDRGWSPVRCIKSVGNSTLLGTYLNGGIVFWVDPTNAANYKVVSLDEQLKDGVVQQSIWANKTTYVLGSPYGTALKDGRQNTMAMLDYSSLHKTDGNSNLKTTGNLETDFPAAGSCYNYQGHYNTDTKGSWYLPASDELNLLLDKIKNGSEIKDGIANNGGLALSDVALYWSATEHTTTTTSASQRKISTTITTALKSIKSNVRCIKATLPLPDEPPVVGRYKDGGVVYWVHPIDMKQYKVVSLDEPSSNGVVQQMKWSSSTSYFTGRGYGRDNDDGRKNTMTMIDVSNERLATATFSADFPAAAYCYNYQGRSGKDPLGTWYLPAINELATLTASLQSADRMLISGIKNNAGIEFTAGVTYLSGTEYDTNNSTSIMTKSLSSSPTNSQKSSAGNIRCVRTTASVPPQQPGVGRFYNNSGVVYWVNNNDRNVYKMVSISDFSSLKAVTSDYDIGSVGQNTSDGYQNMSAILYHSGYRSDLSDFPAASKCYTYRGASGSDTQGTWYLPAVSELGSFTAILRANNKLVEKGIAANGYAFNSGTYASSTEHSRSIIYAYNVLSNGSSTSYKTSFNNVRCMKSSNYTSAPSMMAHQLPSTGDYLYTDNTSSNGRNISKTVDGVIISIGNASSFNVIAHKDFDNKQWASNQAFMSLEYIYDGRVCVENMKSRYPGSFSINFPAADACDKYRGWNNNDAVGVWYLPAKNELQYIWCALNGVQLSAWHSGDSPQGNSGEAKRNEFNALISDSGVSGYGIFGYGDYDYWSSTDEFAGTATAWRTLFLNGFTTTLNKKTTDGFFVRCIKAINR